MKGRCGVKSGTVSSCFVRRFPTWILCLVMGVEPGFPAREAGRNSGQGEKAKNMRKELGLSCLIEADGGVDRRRIPLHC